MVQKSNKLDNKAYEDISMNKELLEWLKESKDKIKDKKKKKSRENSDKQPKGNCIICGKNKAKFVCLKCNNSVCPSCYFNIIGVCKICVPKEYVDIWEKKNPDWKKVLEVDWIR